MRVNFWKDAWCGEDALCFVYPSFFNLTMHKEAMVADMWDRSRGEGGWSPTFLRSLDDWEIEEVERFFPTLQKQNFSSSGEDKLLLKDVRDEVLSVKLMYKGIDPSPVIEFSYRLVWNPTMLPKIGFFACEASWCKVLTLDQLKRLANKCFLCEEDEETIEHLLIHCKKAKTLWDIFLSIVGTCWVFPHSVLHSLLAWQGAPMGKKRKKIWMAAPLCLF